MKQTGLGRQGEFEENYNHGGNCKIGKVITAIFNAVIKNWRRNQYREGRGKTVIIC